MVSDSCDNLNTNEIYNGCFSNRCCRAWIWMSIILSSCIWLVCSLLSVWFLTNSFSVKWNVFLMLGTSSYLYITTIINSSLFIGAQMNLKRRISRESPSFRFHNMREDASYSTATTVQATERPELQVQDTGRTGITPPPSYFDLQKKNDSIERSQGLHMDEEEQRRYGENLEQQRFLMRQIFDENQRASQRSRTSSEQRRHLAPHSAEALLLSNTRLCFEELQRARTNSSPESDYERRQSLPAQNHLKAKLGDPRYQVNQRSTEREEHLNPELRQTSELKEQGLIASRSSLHSEGNRYKSAISNLQHEIRIPTTQIGLSNRESVQVPIIRLNPAADRSEQGRRGSSPENPLPCQTLSKQAAIQNWMIAHSQAVVQRASSDASRSEGPFIDQALSSRTASEPSTSLSKQFTSCHILPQSPVKRFQQRFQNSVPQSSADVNVSSSSTEIDHGMMPSRQNQMHNTESTTASETSTSLSKQFTSCHILLPRSPVKRFQQQFQNSVPQSSAVENVSSSSTEIDHGIPSRQNRMHNTESTSAGNRLEKATRVRRSISYQNLNAEQWKRMWDNSLNKMANREESRMLGARI